MVQKKSKYPSEMIFMTGKDRCMDSICRSPLWSADFHRGVCFGLTKCRCTVSVNKGVCNLSLYSHSLLHGGVQPASGLIKTKRWSGTNGLGQVPQMKRERDENFICNRRWDGHCSWYVDTVPLCPHHSHVVIPRPPTQQ